MDKTVSEGVKDTLEFGQLLRACWQGECSWDVMADWVLERGVGTEGVKAKLNLTDPPRIVSLRVYQPAGLPQVTATHFTEARTGVDTGLHFPTETFAAGFPQWIRNEANLLTITQRNQ